MFDLCAPMKGCVVNQGRYLFLEGDMKYKDNVSKVRNSIKNSKDFFLKLESKKYQISKIIFFTDGCSLLFIDRYFVGM